MTDSASAAAAAAMAVNMDASIAVSAEDHHAAAEAGKRILTRDDKKRLLHRRNQLCSELLQISSILQEDSLVISYDFNTQNLTHKAANSGEMLMFAKELFDKEKPNPALQLAQDIHAGRRGFFTQFDKHIAADPGYTVRRVDGREDLVRDLVAMYKSLYGKSPSMTENMDLKHKSLAELEKILKTYYKDDYKLSNGAINYLNSPYCVTKLDGLPEIVQTEHSAVQGIKVCWNIHDTNHYIQTCVYGKKDKRFKRTKTGDGSDDEHSQG